MKIQFLYHPENDKYIAGKILRATKTVNNYSLDGLKISDINSCSENLRNSILSSDVLILMVSTTFKKIAPYVWFNAIQNKKAIFGINIHAFPDEWGETRIKSAKLSLEVLCGETRMGDIFPVYDLPPGNEGLEFLSKNLQAWCKSAIDSSNNNYDLHKRNN